MTAYKKNALHKRISTIANREWARWKQALGLKVKGGCSNCKSRYHKYGKSRYCFDHRDYGDILGAKVVCYSCNAKLGPGRVGIIDPETLIESELCPFA